MTKWIGVDLDGTLAHYDTWKGVEHIGDPIPLMVDRVEAWMKAGEDVRIFTARVAEGRGITVPHIEKWCAKHLGHVLPITNVKDYNMEVLWDDRAITVEHNTGRRLTLVKLDYGEGL